MQGQGDIPAYGPPQPLLPGRERIAFPLDTHGPRSGVLLGFGAADGPSFPMDGHGFPGWQQNRDQPYGTTAMPNFSMLQTLNKGGRGDAASSLPYVNGKENQEPLNSATGGGMRQHAWNKLEPGGQMIESSVSSLHSVGGPGLEGGPLPLSQKDADMMEHVRAKQHAHLMSHMHQLQAWQKEQQEQLLRQQMEQLARIRQEQEKMKNLLVAQRTGHWGGEVKAPSSPKQRSPSRSKSGLSPTGSRQPLSPSHRPWGSRSPPRSGPGSSPSRPRSTLPDALARASMSPRRLAQSFLPQDDLPQASEAHDYLRQSRTQVPVPAPTDSDVGSVMDDGPPLEMEGVFPLPETASEMEDDQSEDHVQEQGNKTDSKGFTTPPSSPPEDSRSHSSQGSGTPEDERPIKPLSAGRPKTFEQLLEEKLHLEESKNTENVDGLKQKTAKRPFLRKGQGLARFGLTQNRTAGKTPPSEDVQENKHTNQAGRSATQREKAPSSNDKVPSQKTSTHSTPPTSSAVRQPKRLITTLKLRPQPVRKSVAVTKEKVTPQPAVAKEPVDNDDAPPQRYIRQDKEDEDRTAEVHGSPTSVASWDMSFQTRLQELEQKEQLEDEELKEFELLERMAANMSSFIGSTPAQTSMYRSQGPSRSLRQPLKGDNEEQKTDEDDVQLEQSLEEEDSDLDSTIREQPEGEDWGQDEDEEKESKRDSPLETAVSAEGTEELQDRKDEEKEDDKGSESGHDAAAGVSSQALHVDFDDDDSWGDMTNKELDEDDHDTTLDDSIIAGSTPLDTSTPPAKADRLGFSRRGQNSPPSDEAPASVSVEPPPTSELVAKLFPKLKSTKPKVSVEQEEQQQKLHTAAEKSVGEGFQSKVLRDKLAQLETEIERFRQENTALAKLRTDREEGMQRLQQEMTEFEKLKSDELKRLEEFRQQEAAKLKKERKLFEQHKKALLQPDKRERAEIEELREQVQELQDELQRREQRWQSSLNRLKNQLQAAQNESQELREELRMMEKQRLDAWSKAETKKRDHAPVKAFHKQKVTKEISPNKDEEIHVKSSEDSDKSPEMSAPPKSKLQTHNKNRKEKTTEHFSRDEWDSDSIPEETPRKIPIAAALEQHPSGVKASDGPKPRRPLQRKKAVKFAGDEDLSLEEEEADAVEQLQVQHADGKTENVLKDGRRVITFSNGTRKEISADGQTLIVTFFNGDIKQIMPDQRVIYYYAEAQTTHTTYPDGLEILQFPNSQMEKHYPDGTKEITFPDQTIKYLFPNGDEESIFQDGTVLRVSKSGDRVVEFANGQREIHTLNYKKREYPDGTVKTVYPDGKQETRYSNGRIRVKDKEGNIIVDKKM
ncbi:centromere protein J-like isoform X2 [Branchiostoma lanceolatum]|uniref:centromere protein J-like isoform X2 n=1 Tax=Branchiostoma lanceolatum TaxID=7740 RepID=UPI003453C704